LDVEVEFSLDLLNLLIKHPIDLQLIDVDEQGVGGVCHVSHCLLDCCEAVDVPVGFSETFIVDAFDFITELHLLPFHKFANDVEIGSQLLQVKLFLFLEYFLDPAEVFYRRINLIKLRLHCVPQMLLLFQELLAHNVDSFVVVATMAFGRRLFPILSFLIFGTFIRLLCWYDWFHLTAFGADRNVAGYAVLRVQVKLMIRAIQVARFQT